jgi:Uma2 family endonuclease
MPVRAAPVTAEELWELPDDGMRRELVRGDLREMTPAGWEHGRVAAAAGALLFAHTRETGAGAVCGAETGFVLARDPDTVRAPDAALVSRERVDAVGRVPKFWPGAPDLAVEVVSPEDRFGEVEEKALDWLAAGTVAVLVLDPERRTATVYRGAGDAHVHTTGDTLDLTDAVPGWRIAVSELFA